ncbi:MAG: ribonuclease Y [Bdellovibrionaceae bacterium]|nr:ribonuclease Y [Bdellovibrio sp.]
MELVFVLVGFLLGAFVVFAVKRIQDQNTKKSAKDEADRVLNKAKSEVIKIKKDSESKAKDFELKARKNVEMEINKQKSQVKNKESQLERRLKEVEDQFKHRQDENDKFMNQLKDREEKIVVSESRLKELERANVDQTQFLQKKLENVAQMSQDQAKRELFQVLEETAKSEAAKRISEIEDETMREADRKSRNILARALARFASEFTSERTVSVMSLTSDEMKGKIIGREGRNIRTLEALCGVDLIVDDTPETIVISGFDPIRRELARRTVDKLMEDGRVHPARIEEVVEKQKIELAKSMKEEGDKVIVELGITQLHNELVKMLGSLKYRSTHAQNALNSALEVAHISGLLAAELGMNPKIAKRAGLLHNIGLAADHTFEGNYANVGADIAKKFGENEEICHAIRAHHDGEKPTSALAWIVHSAVILSNSRPGARRQQMDNFINRLKDLESISNSFDGVLKSVAVQAGREVRVLVESSRVTDDQSLMLARDIVKKIERELPHVGQVKVTIVRETRSVEMAR